MSSGMTAKALLYDWGGLNAFIFRVVNHTQSALVDPVMVWGTLVSSHTNFPFYVSSLLLAGLIASWRSAEPFDGYKRESRWHVVAAVFAFSYLAGAALLTFLKPYLDFPRPPLALGLDDVRLLLPPEYHHSFPSGHVFFAATFIASLWPVIGAGWRTVGILFVAWVCFSRIKVGAHFPADVLGSCMIGVPVVMAVRLTISRFNAFARRPDRS